MARQLSTAQSLLLGVGGVLVALTLVVLAAGYFGLGIGRSNRAQTDIAPLTQGLVAMGGHEICDTGWNGYGPSDTTSGPWYYVWYTVPDSAAARAFVFKKAAELGRILLPELPSREFPGDDSYDSQPKDDGGLGVDIYQDTTMTPSCDLADSRDITVSGKEAVVGFTNFADK